ncbi:glycosyl transferase [Leptolyngbya sp. 'hensonii']|uniref:glycosyl transferase n=1 Tax=Leptolyngbya sp. 'hensonii' TaxID=1922337 RepID=UPI00094F4D34|nr:glycosyl transferase [Leptolyngbya sp. 'hensonii']OLP17816.1 glycosyl transferase [Leptolyngbya sp. 'hensonii']
MYAVAKQFHLGRVAYWSFHYPKGVIQRTFRRDPIRRSFDEKARQQMEATAYSLTPITLASGPDTPEIHFLTGAGFWYQTCFCAYSMMQQADRYLRPVIYDDGSLEQVHQAAIQRLFPDVRILQRREIEARLNQWLPLQKFPWLRSRRLAYPQLRKLTDIHVGSQGWKLVLDSDMLFFQPPTLLLDWLESPQHPCHMVDVENAYGYSEQLMTALAGSPIPDLVNVGVCGLQSEAIDWEEMEFWCKTLIEQEGSHYYQEQALTAMLMARYPRKVAPAAQYQVLPSRREVMRPTATLHHYVADSKPWYFRYGWRHAVGMPV